MTLMSAIGGWFQIDWCDMEDSGAGSSRFRRPTGTSGGDGYDGSMTFGKADLLGFGRVRLDRRFFENKDHVYTHRVLTWMLLSAKNVTKNDKFFNPVRREQVKKSMVYGLYFDKKSAFKQHLRETVIDPIDPDTRTDCKRSNSTQVYRFYRGLGEGITLANSAGFKKASAWLKLEDRSGTPVLCDHRTWSFKEGSQKALNELRAADEVPSRDFITSDLVYTGPEVNHAYFCVARDRETIRSLAKSADDIVLDWGARTDPAGVRRVAIYRKLSPSDCLVCLAEIYMWTLPTKRFLTPKELYALNTGESRWRVQSIRYNDKEHHFMAYFSNDEGSLDFPTVRGTSQLRDYLKNHPRSLVNARSVCRGPRINGVTDQVRINGCRYFYGRKFGKDPDPAAIVRFQRACKRKLYEPDNFFGSKLCRKALKRFHGDSSPERDGGVGKGEKKETRSEESDGTVIAPFRSCYRITPTTAGVPGVLTVTSVIEPFCDDLLSCSAAFSGDYACPFEVTGIFSVCSYVKSGGRPTADICRPPLLQSATGSNESRGVPMHYLMDRRLEPVKTHHVHRERHTSNCGEGVQPIPGSSGSSHALPEGPPYGEFQHMALASEMQMYMMPMLYLYQE